LQVFSERVLAIFFLTAVIHAIDTLSYSVRIAGIRTKRLALALSLFNIIVLVSRTANMVQAPLLGSVVDRAINTHDLAPLPWVFRFIILAATVGSLLGAALIPTFVNVFVRAIRHLETAGSVPRLLYHGISRQGVRVVRASVTVPHVARARRHLEIGDLPRLFLILNVFITAVYTIGVLASIYGGVLLPAYRLTASQLSGLINGGATILYALMVDPQAALITDQALQNQRPARQVSSMVVFLVLGKVMGTLLGQLLFLPAAELVVAATRLLAH
jgi:hypothetical protein